MASAPCMQSPCTQQGTDYKQQCVARSCSMSRWCGPDRCCHCHCGVVCAQGGGDDDGDDDGDDGDEGEEEGYEEAEPGVELIVVSSRAAHGSNAGSSHRPAHPPGRVKLHPFCTGYLRDALPHTHGAHSVARATRAAANPLLSRSLCRHTVLLPLACVQGDEPAPEDEEEYEADEAEDDSEVWKLSYTRNRSCNHQTQRQHQHLHQ